VRIRIFMGLVAPAAASLVLAGVAVAMSTPEGSGSSGSSQSSSPPPGQVITVIESSGGYSGSSSGGSSGSGSGTAYPSGCRDVDLAATEKSFLFGTKIYRFHQVKHWCWKGGVITNERHAWSFDGSSTACFDQAYPDNSWYFTWWHGKATSGHFSEERAHVTNCVFHVGDWKEFYPDVKIWAYADGTYKVDTTNG
jgi:hypothetical protein